MWPSFWLVGNALGSVAATPGVYDVIQRSAGARKIYLWAVCVGVSHHLDDDRLGRMLDELRRVLRRRLFFLDAVLTPTWISKLLWRYDRGRHPRTADALRREIRARFRIVTDEEFGVLHEYLLVTAR